MLIEHLPAIGVRITAECHGAEEVMGLSHREFLGLKGGIVEARAFRTAGPRVIVRNELREASNGQELATEVLGGVQMRVERQAHAPDDVQELPALRVLPPQGMQMNPTLDNQIRFIDKLLDGTANALLGSNRPDTAMAEQLRQDILMLDNIKETLVREKARREDVGL